MPLVRRVGILGGTFDPIHNGHVTIASAAIKELGLDKIYVVPAFISPHKAAIKSVSPRDRAAMVRRAIKGDPGFSLSLYEISRNRKSYSIDTIRYFRKRLGRGTQLYFIVGADSIKQFKAWKDHKALVKEALFVVFPRPGCRLRTARTKGIRFIGKCIRLDISSSDIREMVRAGKSVSKLVPAGVNAYIQEKRLYNSINGDFSHV